MARSSRVNKRARRAVKTKRTTNPQNVNRLSTELRDLRNKIRQANKWYFNSDETVDKKFRISDTQYDALQDRLRELSPNDRLLVQTGVIPSKAERKVRLPYPMPSLDKIKPNESLERYLARTPGPYHISDKLDGVSSALVRTKDGLKLYTRGNGATGTDISHLLPYIKPKITTLPSNIKAIRGELVILRNTFTRKYAKQFENSRNLTSGVVNSSSINPAAKDLVFLVHQVIDPAKSIESVKGALKTAGFVIAPGVTKTKIDERFLLEYLAKRREASKVDIDGLVITSRSGAIAFKAGYESAQAEVDKVTWRASRDGYLNPVIHLKKGVRLSGVTVSKMTGHNARMLVDMKVGPGAIIEVTRSGDVIPKIMRTVKPSRISPLPPGMGVTYTWNDNKVALVLLDRSSNTESIVHTLVTFLIRLEVDKVKSNSVEKLVESGIDTIPKLIASSVADFTDAGLGHASAVHLHDRLRSQLKLAELPALMAGSNIFGRGFGETRFNEILNDVSFKQQLTLYKRSRKELQDRIAVIPGIGLNTAMRYVQSLPTFVRFLKEINWKPTRRLPQVVRKSGLGPAPIVVFTGFRDKGLEQEVKSVGGQVGRSVTKNTTHLVALNPNSTTDKTRKAERYGARIIGLPQFRKLLTKRS